MKHALLPFALVLTMMAGLVASATGSIEPQSTSAGSIYGRRCASCHGRDGRADTAKGKLRGARNLTDPQWQAEVSDERIFNSITNGRGKMPSYGKTVTEAQTNSLVSYVRGLKK